MIDQIGAHIEVSH